MSEQLKVQCTECDTPDGVGRRDFLLAVGGTAVTLAGLEAVPKVLAAQPGAPAAQPAQKQARPAEALIRELYQGLSAEQRQRVVYPWNHTLPNESVVTRKRMYNAAIFPNHNIGAAYTRAQVELNERILRAIASDEQGHRCLTRNGTFDNTGSFARCGAFIFGDPTGDNQFAWVFSGHHLTVRCDGNSEPDAGFGGPMYYGHSPDGHSVRNVFNFQTRSAMAVWDALTDAQRRQATIATSPGEQLPSVQFRRENFPGIASSALTADQRRLVSQVMRDLLSPYRREDADEVMELVGRNGGMERLHMGYFRGANTPAGQWNFWRIEGPGFVWNFRVLPHVHCFVNIAVPPRA